MKYLFLVILVISIGVRTFGQKENKSSSSFTISGEVKSPLTVQITDLKKWMAVTIGDVIITNHLGEKKSESKGLKGILLRDVLSSVEISSSNPKVLSEYYFVCKANDGYTVVYSWNEVFNTATGDSVFIVTEKEGQSASAMADSILMISSKDLRTGRRHMKALTSIEVKRAQ